MYQHTTTVTKIAAGELFSQNYTVPLYQRGYAWGQEEIWQLLDDLHDAFGTAPERNYHLGSLTVFSRCGVGGIPEYELIDGQQRAITLGLLLRLLADAPTGLAGRLRFANRPEAEAFLAVFDTSPDTATAMPKAFRAAVDAMLDHEMFGAAFAEKRTDFKIFVQKRVILFRVEMPPETDVAAYFEIMNNRGRQLEAADLIKARLVAKLADRTDKILFDRLWTACSDMRGHLEDRLDWDTASALCAGTSWTQLANDAVTITDESTQNSAPRSLIPDFPNFLLHVFRVFLKAGPRAAVSPVPSLDERQLRTAFDALRLEDRDGKAEWFLDVLLRTRLRFDRFVVKAEGGADSGESRWSLTGRDSWSPRDKERLIHLESMLQVTYSARRGKEWVSQVLLSDKEDAPSLIDLLEQFVRERVKERGPMENWTCAGTSTPHVALNLLDYLMYCQNPQEYSGNKSFRFAYRNSVEHHFPRGSAEGGWGDGNVDDIGNLYLLSQSDNSSLNVRSPNEKVGRAGKRDDFPPKRREMYRLTQEGAGWTPKVMQEHSQMVRSLLADFLTTPNAE